MPTKQLVRYWCHKCQEFTIQEMEGTCLTCDTINESYKLSDVPKEKLEAQRERYKASRLHNIYNPYISLLNADSLNASVEYDNRTTIIEADAGQKAIDEAKRKKREEWQKEREWRKEEYLKFKGTNRNDLCPCGSKKKYKHCCLNRFSDL